MFHVNLFRNSRNIFEVCGDRTKMLKKNSVESVTEDQKETRWRHYGLLTKTTRTVPASGLWIPLPLRTTSAVSVVLLILTSAGFP